MQMHNDPEPMPHLPAQSHAPAPSSWRSLVIVVAFLAVGGYSVYIAAKLLFTRCEGFSCTYVGVAWLFWAGVLWLPATGLGYFAQKSSTQPRFARQLLRLALLAHTVFALGLLVWWLLHGD